MNRPIPDIVLQGHPGVDPAAWRWESDVRLVAPHGLSNYVVLVALAPDHSHWMSQSSVDDPDARTKVWSRLETLLAADLAARDGCRAGAPLARDDDPDRCQWCGIDVNAHELPADVGAGATYQETHVRIGDQVVTSVEAEAAFTVALADLKYNTRGRPGD